jgi:signal transduction histidine kinase/ligand-binding sensor domain-containing protein
MKGLIKFLICVNVNALCFGQSTTINFHQLTVLEGLSQSTNAFLHTDKQGYIWIGSMDGVNKFDGKTVKVFKPSSKNSFHVKGAINQSPFFEVENESIWFTTNEAINRYKKTNEVFISDFIKSKENEHSTEHYAFFLEKKRFLWVISERKLYRYDSWLSNKYTQNPILYNFYAVRCDVITDEEGAVEKIYGCNWNSKPGFELIKLSQNGKIWSRCSWFDKLGNPADFTLTIRQVVTDNGSIAWFVTDKGLLYFDESNPERYKLIPLAKNQEIKSIIPFSKNLLWVLSSSSQILVFDKETKEFLPKPIQLFNLDKKSNIDNVNHLFPIRDSLFCISSYGTGIYFANIANINFSSLLNKQGVEQQPIDYLYEDLNGIIRCISETGGRWSFNGDKNFKGYNSTVKYIKKIIINRDALWYISTEEFGTYSNKNNKYIGLYPIEKSDIYFDGINFDNHYLVLGTNKGIIFFDKKSKMSFYSIYKGLAVKLLLDSKKKLWTVNASQALTVWKVTQNPSINLSPIDTFPNLGLINDIIEDPARKVIWVGTSKGLVRINTGTLEQESILTEQDGLPNQFINSIIIDKRGRLWLSTNKGIVRYVPEAKEGSRFKHFTSRDGLSSDEYLPGSKLLSSKGEIWFGSTKGVDVFDPDKVVDVGRAPKLAINSLHIHGAEWKGDTAIGMIKHVKLDYTQNSLTFDLAALEYLDPLRNQFKTYLWHEGRVDSSFQGTNNKITYANLSPGAYLFQFTACNAEGIWQTKRYELEITIDPPFWQTWWFRTLVMLAALALVSYVTRLYYRTRLRTQELKLEKQQRAAERTQLLLEKTLVLQQERSRIADEMHDELSGGLSSIRNASERARKNQDLTEVQYTLARVSQLAVTLIKNMREIIWAMDPENDSLADLAAHLRERAKEFLEDNGINSQISIPADLPARAVSGKVRHNVSLVVREALHNIVKHAEATEVGLALLVNHTLQIRITDNGKGFDPAQVEKPGKGLRSMQNRIRNIGGTIEWRRRETRGMEVYLQLPLDRAL